MALSRRGGIAIKGANGADDADRRDGANGKDGSRGVTGTAGRDGEDGQNGVGIRSIEKTGSADGVDTYTIYLTDGTSYPFTVTNGKDGNGIAAVKINETGDMIITLTDGSEINAGSVRNTVTVFSSNSDSGSSNLPLWIISITALLGNTGWIIPLVKKRRI